MFLATHSVYGSAADPIKVGLLLAYSGPYAALGEGPGAAIEMLVADVNKKGGIKGRTIELVKEDEACDPSRAVASARKLLSDRDVIALIGPSCSPSGVAIKPLVLQAQIPWMATVGTNVPYTPVNPWVFNSNGPSSRSQARAALAFAQARNLPRVAILRQNDTYGDEAVAAVRELAPEYGVTVVSDATVAANATDVSAQVKVISDAKPDLVILACYFQPGGVFLRQSNTVGFDVPMVGFVATSLPQILKLAPPQALAKFYGQTSTVDVPEGPKVAAFVESFRKFAPAIAARPGEPATFTMMVYSSAETLFEGMRRASALTPKDIAAALAGLKDYKPTYFAGPLSFSASNHDGVGSVAFFTVDAKTGTPTMSNTVVQVKTGQ
jgi:branched-chain amino acid transport system substrate-binding protein